MKALWKAYHDKAMILVIYIREAHPAKADQTAENAGWKVINGMVFRQPKTYEERRKLAETACTFWELPIPALVDTMEPSIGATYRAWPNRSYLIDTEGKIVYHGVKGPPGVNVHECELKLRELLGITEGSPVTKPPPKRRAPTGRGRLSGRRRTPPKAPEETPGSARPSKTPWWLIDEPKEDAKPPAGPAEEPKNRPPSEPSGSPTR